MAARRDFFDPSGPVSCGVLPAGHSEIDRLHLRKTAHARGGAGRIVRCSPSVYSNRPIRLLKDVCDGEELPSGRLRAMRCGGKAKTCATRARVIPSARTIWA